MSSTPRPVEISLHQKSRILKIAFDNGESFTLSYEYLRVHSPSAEVQGHGHGQGVLQTGKEDVMITHVAPVGSYAIQPISMTVMTPVSIPGKHCINLASTRNNTGRNTWTNWPPPATRARNMQQNSGHAPPGRRHGPDDSGAVTSPGYGLPESAFPVRHPSLR